MTALLAGPPGLAAERYAEHRARLGPLPPAQGLIDLLVRSDLRGRGGAAFPTGTKWRAVAERARKRPVVLVNGAEGEPWSQKDRLLMLLRPHLVLDGAILAAQAVDARDVVVYIGDEHRDARDAMRRAALERPVREREMMTFIESPRGYVSGEESAAVHFVNDGVALPVSVPPRPYERGVHGRPTLVNNVESLAHAALIARHGDAWFHGLGRNGAAGTVLLTLSGAVHHPGVIEVPQGACVGEAVELGGGASAPPAAVMVGGYFGTWIDAATAWNLPLDSGALRAAGHSLGCGVVHVLPADACGVAASSSILTYLAGESARQCGPCLFGLHAIAGAAARLSIMNGDVGDLQRLQRWCGLVTGRGGCKHPDGAAQLMRSALAVFAADIQAHATQHHCVVRAPLAQAS